jgi:hypothetical protein
VMGSVRERRANGLKTYRALADIRKRANQTMTEPKKPLSDALDFVLRFPPEDTALVMLKDPSIIARHASG